MKKCNHCYLRNAKPCYECGACVRGDDHFRPVPSDKNEKGCEYCTLPEKYMDVLDYADTRLFVGVSGSFIRIFNEEYPGFNGLIRIDHCPKCGRKLTT